MAFLAIRNLIHQRKKLAWMGVLSRDQADQKRSALDQANAAVRAAEAQLNQFIAQRAQTQAQLAQTRTQVQTMLGVLKQAEINLRYAPIVSPIKGTIVARNVDVGQSVVASLQAPVVFSIAQNLKRMQVYAKVDESDIGNIRIGTPATFQVDAFPNERFSGRVSAIRKKGNPEGGPCVGSAHEARFQTGSMS